MAATINVDLSVDDAKFIAFFHAFESFSKSVNGSATKWGKINSEMGAAASHSRELIDQSGETADNIERARQAVSGLKPMTETISRGWNALAMSTAKISANLKEATLALLRWSGITGLVAGAGTWGMGALGQSVTSDRAAAMGAGTTYGGRQAFGIAFSRFGGADSVLSKVAAIQASSDHTALKALGLSDEEIRNLDPAELAARAYQALGRGARAQPKDRLGDWMRSRRIDEVFDLGQARQAGQASGTGEMNDLVKSFRANRERFDRMMTPDVQSAWVKFNMQIEISTIILRNTFYSAVAKLAQGLTAIMNSFTSLVDKLLKDDGPFGQALDDFNEWLDKTIKTLDDKKVREWFDLFMNSVKTLVGVTWDLVKGLASLLRFFGVTPAEASTVGQQGALGTLTPGRGMRLSGDGGGGRGRRGLGGGGWGAETQAPESQTARAKELMDALVKRGWTPEGAAIVAGNASVESGFKFSATGDPSVFGGSHDIIQWNRERWAGFKKYAAEHSELTGMELRAAYIDKEVAAMNLEGMKHAQGLSQAGSYSHAYEGYSTATTGARVARAQQFLENYHKTRVTIHKPVGNDTNDAANATAHATP